MLESKVEKYLREQVNKRGGLCWKFTSPGTRGVPDRIVMLGRRIVFVETKAPKEELRKLQEKRKAQIEAQGLLHYAVDTKEKVDNLLSHFGADQ
ncbi:VRR-NUC domain-containing protein [Listeria monocytogenes]|nr:VRR-NUC domain-containing protein [Listeria monocytogenes]EAD7113396.1 VRR-NUC domain-containing protein [Listeria monocytogenes]EKP1419869.1 VRR-NUC domain-containing protein [Listeria monocytogenes]EKQ6255559.1 VRR-NUC domain-containing protein [Listeria monocytogenes]